MAAGQTIGEYVQVGERDDARISLADFFAFVIECIATSILASLVMRSLEIQQSAPPGFTAVFFSRPLLWLTIPIPWLIGAAVLNQRRSQATTTGFIFLGSLVIAGAFVLGIMVIASGLPVLTY